MSKRKKSLVLRKNRHKNKKTSKGKGKKSNNVANSVTSHNQYNDLQSKFKLKELRIVLHDIAANNIILPCRQPCVDKNMGSLKVIDKCKDSTNKRIYSKNEKSSLNNIVSTECSSKTSSGISIGKHDSDEKITKEQNIYNNFDIQTKLLNVRKQKACFHGHAEHLLISDSKDKKKKDKCRLTNGVGYTRKSESRDLCIAATSSSRNECLDLFNEAISPSNVDTKKMSGKQSINCNKQNEETRITYKDLIKDKCSIIQTDAELSKEAQKVLINQEDTSRINNQNSLKERDLPKITEDKILAENTILVKMQDNMQIANSVQDETGYTNAVLQNKSNECFSIEKHSRVADLTEDNLYKFMENYNNCVVSEKNIVPVSTTENFQNSANNNSTEITFKINKNDLNVPYRKRGWITQKTAAELDKSGIKRIKLNRKCIQENNCTTKNSSVCLSDNKNSNLFSKCHSKNINNDTVKNMDDCLTLYSSNSSCTINVASGSTKANFNDILRSTHIVEKNTCTSSYTMLINENEKNEISLTAKYHQNAESTAENTFNENKILSCSTQLNPQNHIENKINDNHDNSHNDGVGNDNQNNDSGDDNNRNNNSGDDDNQNNDSGNNNHCNNGDDDDNDDDCISLFADSLLSIDPVAVSSNENKTKSTFHDYKMTKTTFNKYLQQNIVECNKEFDTITDNDTSQNESNHKFYQTKYKEIKQSSTPALQKLTKNVESISSINSHMINNNSSSYPDRNYNKPEDNICDDETVMTCTKQMESITCQRLCWGYCFAKMRHGDCNRISCHFNHDLQTLIRNIILKYKQYLISIINYINSMKYYYFLKRLYIQSLQEYNVACILNLYETIYSIKCSTLNMVVITVEVLLNKGLHPKDVADSLCKIISNTDDWTPQFILAAIRNKIQVGEYWDSLRNLFEYCKPTKEVIESILNDCLITHKNVQDVHINLIKRLHPIEVNLLNRDLMLSFNNLLKHENQKTTDRTSPKLVSSVTDNNEGSSKESYMLQSISDLPEAHSQYRDRFWKLYLMIYNIKEALVHEDYDYVISILNKYEEINEDESLFCRCCFHMLTAEIKHSEYHISKIIEHAVQIGASSVLYKVLLDVATCILVKLIIENAWTLAYKLLKNLQMYNLQHDAAFIILSAEIYLANKHAIKALMLMKQSNIISTNRDNWNVASNAQDYYLRTSVINILLDVLCINSPEHAFFIFQFLSKDQGNNFRPIDLTHYVDKLMLKLLLEREIDLIIRMGYMIIEYNFSFVNITICRAAIASIVHIDMVLAKQLYQYASGLGIYRTIELLPVIHVIINADWVEEEIYLTFWDLFQRLAMDIGHSIDHLNSVQLSVYVIFEIVPTEAHLYCEDLDDQQMKKIQMCKNLVRQVLRTRFEPAILFSRKPVNGAIIKLQSKVIINHLKEIYKNYSQ